MALEVRTTGSIPFAPPQDGETKLFVCVSGTSESGKSTLSKLLFESGMANRVKYLRVARELGSELYGIDDPFEFLEMGDEEQQLEHARLIWERIHEITETNQRITVVETIKHPALVRSLARLALNVSSCVVFVDAPFDSRVARESAALGLDAAAVAAMVAEKDQSKIDHGSEQIRGMADVLVFNDCERAEYTTWIAGFGADLQGHFPDRSDRQPDPIEYL